MSDIVSKISLYDILAMIVPGCILLWCVAMIPCVSEWVGNCACVMFIKSHPEFPQTICFWAIFLVLAYVVGLINHMCIFGIWKLLNLSNRPQWIWEYLQNNVETYYMTNTKGLLVSKKLITEKIAAYKEKDAPRIRDAYFEAYTIATENTINNTVPIIENQVAMLRSLIFPLSLLVFMACDKWLFSLIGAVVVIAILVIMAIMRMKKIYALVFENYEYAKRRIDGSSLGSPTSSLKN